MKLNGVNAGLQAAAALTSGTAPAFLEGARRVGGAVAENVSKVPQLEGGLGAIISLLA